MPTLDWLRREFSYGYDSGNILSIVPDAVRRKEEKVIGGSYRKIFFKAIAPYIRSNSVVLELGPGKGSWSRAILRRIPKGTLHVVDFQNVEKWLQPERYNGRLVVHVAEDNSFSCLEDNYFDFFWSFGVLCHNNIEHIEEILYRSISKLKSGGISVHQYADWDKLDDYGWGKKSNISSDFKDKSDDDIWWPRNNQKMMSSIAEKTGWTVISPDLGLVKRDSVILMRRE